ncbi:hypothetical protein ABOM_002069 [Aspergillus bombycis]|uniref:Cytochrome P450 n=1 Tax=Aspergillus bombycis TaxID=109264 RepID=A0A1F8AA87_9EURO|nr:hypothetical protein ABOM_002069 [Aspergillus bombycis]OGM48636.1 hypothetical protein ABOM_002069 [Aspergillus bombycis]
MGAATILKLLIALIVSSATAFALRLMRASRRSASLPPGPPTLPLIGNIHQIPSAKGFLKFQKWARIYGPVVSLKVGPKDLIILNSASAVRDLFDKRGAIYSSRPPNYIGTEVITQDNTHLLLMPYGKEWRNQRKLFQELLNIKAVGSLRPLQAAESTFTLRQLMQSPQDYYDHIRRYSTAVILASVFGIRGSEFHSPYIQRLYHVQDQFTAILETGATPPIDVFPFLKYMPAFLAPWRKWAQQIRKEQRELYFELLQSVRSTKSRGVSHKCFVDMLLEESFQRKYSLDDEHIAYIGGVLMEGGSDTTASALLSFLLAMARNPRVLRKAQAAVDALCGTERSPTFDDMDNLPYIKHCVTEVLRWRPVAAGGIPHVLTEDDVYGTYHFPKGTTFLANTWAIHHDPENYEHPEAFMPERFEQHDLGFKSGAATISGLNRTYGFGAGRRVCPGSHLAENSLLINIAKLVWAFDITPGADPATGRQLSHQEIDDNVGRAWTNGFLIAPKPFPLSLSLRSEKHGEVIEREHEEANETLVKYTD